MRAIVLKAWMMAALVFITMAGAQMGSEYCEIVLNRCPEEYDGDTLVVPLSVVSLSSKIKACANTAFGVGTQNARRISVATWGRPDTVDNIGDDEFAFNRMLPLDTSVVAPVKMSIWYEVTEERDTILNGIQQIVTVQSIKEQGYNFWIRRTANPPNNWAVSQGLTARCATKPTITVWWDSFGNGNLVPVTVIKSNMTKLVVRFDKKDDFYGGYTLTPPNGVVIEISTTAGSKLDTLYTTSLTPYNQGTYFQWELTRNGNATNNEIVVRNSTLEHNTTADMIVFHFRNPLIPLDEIVVEIPYISYDLVFKTAIDGVAQPGYIKVPPPKKDTVAVQAGKRLDITAILLDWEDKVDAGMLSTGTVTWWLSSYENATLEPTEGPNASFTGKKAYTYYTVTAEFLTADGNLVIQRTFVIYVKPGDPQYLQVVFANPKIKPPPAQVISKSRNRIGIPDDTRDTTLYVVERDEFGNLIGPTAGRWNKVGDAILINSINSYQDSTVLTRESKTISAGNLVIVEKTVTRADGSSDVLRDTVEVINGILISVLTPNRVVPQVQPKTEEATVIAPSVVLSGEFTAGPNPVLRQSGIVNFYRQGRRVGNSELRIYDATGNIINKVRVSDKALNNQSRRIVGSWDLTDVKGRQVPEGTYLVKGVVKTSDGKSEKISLILSVR